VHNKQKWWLTSLVRPPYVAKPEN